MSDQELLDRYLRNECDDTELAEIKRRLREDAEFGKTLVDYSVETAQLIGAAGEVATAVAEPPVKQFPVFKAVVALAACAAVVFVVLRGAMAPQHEPVAMLVREVAAKWAQGSPDASMVAVAGDTAELVSGFAEFEFQNGARLILEGPAELQLLGPDRARLVSGRAVARLPEGVEGFVLETPVGEVVDRGTEFGVVVDEHEDAQVHVLSGAVDITKAGDKMATRLADSQAVAISSSAMSEFTAAPDLFMRTLPVAANSAPEYVHWSFDQLVDGDLPDEGTGIDGERWAARMRGIDGSPGPEAVDGMIGKALYFDGSGAFLETDFAGVGEGDSRTVAFWVKVPEDAKLNEAYAMLGWGSFKYKGATWQISWNCEAEDGPLGRLRAGVHGGQVIGSQDLRDGRWHHVAVVLFGGDRPDIATHVMLYVDGELEQASRKSVRAVQTDLTPGAKTVHAGKNAGGNPKKRFFRGWLDDVVIANEPLSPEQIRAVMRKGGNILQRQDGAL